MTAVIHAYARRQLQALLAGAALAWSAQIGAAPSVPTADAEYAFADVGRVVAFADVHGAFDALTALLGKAGVVDAQLRWSGGRTHLVSTGDLLDRGRDSRKVMDLLMRLQHEAAAAGGRVHVLLGNHEAMNLLGHVRDVDPAEFAAYVSDEPDGLRERLRAEWTTRHGADPAARFDARFPPGYFGHRAALAPDGTYGKWLHSLPVAIVLNGNLFMHGGPSRVLDGLTLSAINQRYHAALAAYHAQLAALEADGLVLAEDDFDTRAERAAERHAARRYANPADQARNAQALRRFAAADDDPMIGADGPNWYRGAALCNACAEADVLQPILAKLGARRLVIGHTVTRDARVATRFDGTVIKLDTGMNHAVYRGRASALILENVSLSVLYADSEERSTDIASEGIHLSSSTLGEAEIATLLEQGDVSVTGPRGPGMLDVVVRQAGRRVNALFLATTTAAGDKELAAMKLDRALGLGLVPATVRREVQGQHGILQARPAHWTSEAAVQASGRRGAGWCALPPQFELMYAFDALIGNEGRSADRMLYDAQEWNLVLTGHDRAFGVKRELPAWLRERAPRPGAELRRRLALLDEATLEQAIGPLLGKRERKLILQRRDDLLARPAAARSR